jgi:hypothetical protein
MKEMGGGKATQENALTNVLGKLVDLGSVLSIALGECVMYHVNMIFNRLVIFF